MIIYLFIYLFMSFGSVFHPLWLILLLLDPSAHSESASPELGHITAEKNFFSSANPPPPAIAHVFLRTFLYFNHDNPSQDFLAYAVLIAELCSRGTDR
jgi:hypothetical protein